MTEPTYPYADGDVTVLGPEIFASTDGDVISWKGDNYVRQAAVSAGVAPATDQGALRDRIAEALLARIKWATVSKDRPADAVTSLLAANEFDLADAVLAVLPATVDRAAEEAYRLALSAALRLGTGANWEAIRDRAEDLVAEVEQLTSAKRRLLDRQDDDPRHALDRIERLALAFEVSGNEFIAERIRAAVTGVEPQGSDGKPPAPQPVQHAPGKVILCPDCRAKGHSVCTAAESAPADTGHDGSEPEGEAPCCSDPTCACIQVNAAGRCECARWDAGQPTDERPEVVHGCPPDGSGLTPCCGRTPFELPLTDRISSEAPVTCPGAAAARQPKEA